jgi:hypothetical protein
MAFDRATVHPVGYEVTLCAPVPDLAPACAACLDAFTHLQAVAAAVMPDGNGRPTVCRVRPFDSSLHLRPGPRRLEPEVQLVVEVEHGHDYFAVIDECEGRCARDIQDGLRRLGAVPAGSAH